ncbi:MAG: hypothetical protein DWQ19_12985 [Crenarchaeota archaeon]|nr:MAG: hypothetical protein DWQ19_12985 [Thermoproteota archaeon]
MLTYKNAQAYAVLAGLYASQADNFEMLIVEPYCNGREQGFALELNNKKVAFSEGRNSDYIVIYCGKSTDFSDGNIPSEKVYTNRRLVEFLNIKSAIEIIEDWLQMEFAEIDE